LIEDVMAESRFIFATGRRKTSVARVRLMAGTGKLTVNKKPLNEYLTVATYQSQATLPLRATESLEKYDLWIDVRGGGPSGQAGAIRHGIARALLKAAPELKGTLRERGYLTRDARMKERKKYGQPGARKRFQFSKR
jgi:small subunit ribosomal protein S9